MQLKIKKLNPEAKLPSYAHKGDAGLDLFSCEDAVLKPGERKMFSTGISTEFPEGYVALIWDKSGIAASGIKTMGGVLEHTYRGEYKVITLNTSSENYEIKKGQKIAQLLIQPIVTAEVEEANELSETKRGEGAFGSTGLNV
ncbi:deoxyuridine 5'-triphosphate nucleotidohydrolase [Candidatus Pacearchaeota archaeon RBG_13_36_9]|nr:MAG: deoxyuridine 5'-triphosphate nucleotidohydrolase [Candidatus Pacearchaeota archaeon RBG_13_36_9]